MVTRTRSAAALLCAVLLLLWLSSPSLAAESDAYAGTKINYATTKAEDIATQGTDPSSPFALTLPSLGAAVETTGDPFAQDASLDFAVRVKNATDGSTLSFWHDVPTFPPSADADAGADADAMVVNYVNEIPRGTFGKLEVIKERAGNPIMYDRKDVETADGEVVYERPRFMAYGPSPFNYGAIPGTWEDSVEPDPITGIPGDNDPIDAVDIGAAQAPPGAVYEAKVLGALPLLDDGETDWKVRPGFLGAQQIVCARLSFRTDHRRSSPHPLTRTPSFSSPPNPLSLSPPLSLALSLSFSLSLSLALSPSAPHAILLSFPFLSFPFLSFPFLRFPFLCFPFFVFRWL